MKLLSMMTIGALTAQDIGGERRNNSRKIANFTSQSDSASPTQSNYNLEQTGKYGGYGDPHFVIAPAGNQPLCFDINPHDTVSQLNFLIDPVSSLSIVGKTEPSSDHKGKTFITEVQFNSPEGVRLEFNKNGVAQVNESGANKKLTGEGTIEDITYHEHLSSDGTHERTIISIVDGPSFELVERFEAGSYSVKVTDQTGISSKARGVFGVFMDHDYYRIIPNGTSGTVMTSRKTVVAIKKNFHHTEDCWVISEEDALDLIN